MTRSEVPSDALTPVDGIRYYIPAAECRIYGRDGKVDIPCNGLPLPLLEEDYQRLEGSPGYDAVGRGIYHLLRANPDSTNALRYAEILKQGYPHLLAELASHMLMLHVKDVEVPYIDRKINYLKIFILLEPDNPRYPLEVGLALMEKGLRLSALHLSTASLYKSLDFLRKAEAMAPEDVEIQEQLGEVSFLLGKYEAATALWRRVAEKKGGEAGERLLARVKAVQAGHVPRVPAVDYLEAIGGAFALYEQGEYEEAAAILQDVFDDPVFAHDFPVPEVHYVIGMCCKELNMPRFAEESFNEALRLKPDYAEARRALEEITGASGTR